MSTAPQVQPTIVIEPKGSHALRFHELWAYRELFFFLMWRDIKVRYKQTALGASWAVLQPLLLMVVFTIFLGQLSGVGPEGVPYPLFALAGLVPWTFFANGIAGQSNSLVGSSALVSKIYFPRLLLPLASGCSFLLDLVVSFLVLLALMAVYSYQPSADAFLLPLYALWVLGVSIGAGLWLAALNVRYRDVRYAVPFLIQLWLFATPVAYQFSIVPPTYELIFALNPMVGAIEGFRSALLGIGGVPANVLLISSLSGLVLLVSGFLYFRRVERSFADVI